MLSKEIRTYSNDPELIEKKRAEITEKAIKLFIRKGYLKTTTREIAQACGMSTGALYHYIGTKEDILSLLSKNTFSFLQNFSKEYLNKSEVIRPKEKLKIVLKKYLQRIDKIQEILLFWYQESKNLPQDALKNIFAVDSLSIKIIEEILIEGYECGDFHIKNIKLAACNIIILCDNWATRRWYMRKLFSIDKFIEDQIDFILKALSNDEKT